MDGIFVGVCLILALLINLLDYFGNDVIYEATAVLLPLLWVLTTDGLMVGFFFCVLIPLSIYKPAAFAVLKRNFIGYFSNPTGYVFLCLFVLLTSLAAFWAHEFFTSNMANLDQLNKYLPLIMLIFVPAITMSIWAEERRQGTDELLLTLPAGDFDIVIGKYLAAASIFTASLLFSQLSHYSVLVSLTLGDLDTGLLFSTYFGYWLAGLAMIAVGMVASFLTSNLTVGFILGALFNAPLAFASEADLIIPSASWAQVVRSWSMIAQFDDFGRRRDQPFLGDLFSNGGGFGAVFVDGVGWPAPLGWRPRRAFDAWALSRPCGSPVGHYAGNDTCL